MTEILEIIKSHSEKCDNKCGFKFTDLVNLVDLPIEELKSQLLQLYQEKKIHFRKGINSILIFYGKKEVHR